MNKKILFVILLCLSFIFTGCSVQMNVGESKSEKSSGLVSSITSTINSKNNSQLPTQSSNSVEPQKSEQGGSSSVGGNSQKPANSTVNSTSSAVLDNSSGTHSVPQTTPSGEYTLKNADISGDKIGSSVDLFRTEGYGKNVTGGGNLKLGDTGYVQVKTAEEFIKAVGRKNYDDKTDANFPTRPMVVEVMNDLDLGYNEIGSAAQGLSDVVAANGASVHPTLKKTGVSLIYINARENLTIYSKNGATIKHACFQIRGYDNKPSNNIIIRNLRFIGCWEWDDSGKYDANDWDIFTIRGDKGKVSNVLIDHCTFTKPYDGTIDVKYGATDITISWCNFLAYDNTDADFMDMMNYLEANKSSFPNYNSARSGGATFDDMVNYSSINKKVHLIGHTDNNAGDENIRVTYANNYYENCTERLPRLRLGKAHVYNCIFNATKSNELKNSIASRGISWPTALTFASNGSLGTNYGELLLENCHISGINTPLRNNNKNKGEMYTGKCEALYTYYTVENIDRSAKYGDFEVKYTGRYTFLGHSTINDGNLVSPFPITPQPFDTDAFKNGLNYDYTLYNPLELGNVLGGKVGAGINMSQEFWLVPNASSNYKASSFNGLIGSTANLGAGRK